MNYFIKAMLTRAIRTICQTAIATIGTAVVLSDVNWQMVISASLLAGLLSMLTSVATGLPEVDAVYAKEANEIEYEEFEDFDEDWSDYDEY